MYKKARTRLLLQNCVSTGATALTRILKTPEVPSMTDLSTIFLGVGEKQVIGISK